MNRCWPLPSTFRDQAGQLLAGSASQAATHCLNDARIFIDVTHILDLYRTAVSTGAVWQQFPRQVGGVYGGRPLSERHKPG